MPKCLVEVQGQRVIDYILGLLNNIENVRIVVGFMEDQVIEYVRSVRSDVVFVRNPRFQSTSNAHSLWLATRDLREPYIAIDGDLLIEPESFRRFLDACDGSRSVIGVAESKTEEAVFVELDDSQREIRAFYRAPRTPYEWCGIACLTDITVSGDEQAYVFQQLERHLPLAAHVIDCFEIDTPDDLSYATEHFRPAKDYPSARHERG